MEQLRSVKVEWLPLGNALVRTKGTKITAGQMKELHKENAPVKIFAGGKTVAFVDFNDIPQKDINNDPSIIVKSRGIIEFEYYDKPFSHKNEMWSYHSKNKNIDVKYVYYFLKQNEPHFQQIGSKMQMPQIATPDTDKFLIPIPDINIQKNIVKTLDKLTELEATLEATLEAENALRIKQYHYYRNLLLTFDENHPFVGAEFISARTSQGGEQRANMKSAPTVVWKRLGEVCNNILSGKNKIRNENGIFPIYGSTGIIGKTDNYVYEKEQILIARVGANAGFVHIGYGKYDVSDNTLIIQSNGKIILKYLFYLLENMKLNQFAKGAGQPLITAGQLKSMEIPIPDLQTQQKIVEILDKFDCLTNSITEGLPKEIELRRKQYEYYREQLLTFPKDI